MKEKDCLSIFGHFMALLTGQKVAIQPVRVKAMERYNNISPSRPTVFSILECSRTPTKKHFVLHHRRAFSHESEERMSFWIHEKLESLIKSAVSLSVCLTGHRFSQKWFIQTWILSAFGRVLPFFLCQILKKIFVVLQK